MSPKYTPASFTRNRVLLCQICSGGFNIRYCELHTKYTVEHLSHITTEQPEFSTSTASWTNYYYLACSTTLFMRLSIFDKMAYYNSQFYCLPHSFVMVDSGVWVSGCLVSVHAVHGFTNCTAHTCTQYAHARTYNRERERESCNFWPTTSTAFGWAQTLTKKNGCVYSVKRNKRDKKSQMQMDK